MDGKYQRVADVPIFALCNDRAYQTELRRGIYVALEDNILCTRTVSPTIGFLDLLSGPLRRSPVVCL